MRKILILLLLFAVIPVAYADITVGVDYESLSEALEHAELGDTIRVPAGVYPAGVSVDKQVTIVGEGEESVLLADGSMSIISVAADDVIIDGLTFAPSYSGITISGDGVTVKNCFFVENMIGVDVVGDGVYVTGCDFTGCGYAGIRAEGTDGARIGGNNFDGCLNGVFLSFSEGSGVVDNTLHSSDDGMVLEGVYNSTFSGNQFDGCNTSISLVDSGWNTFMGHTAEGVFLELDNCIDNLAEDNVVDGVYAVQRYSGENRYRFNGLTVIGDMFSISVIELDYSDYVSLSDILIFEMLPDPVYGGSWVEINADIPVELTEDAIPDTLGLYDLDSMDMLAALTQNGSRLVSSFSLDEDVTCGFLMQIDADPPVAVINAPKIGQVGDVFYLDAGDSSDNTGIVDYEWNLGDGETESGVIAQHYYSSPGEYTVTLKVVDASGQIDSTTHNITIIIDEEPEEPVSGSNQMIWVALIIVLGVAGLFLYSRNDQL